MSNTPRNSTFAPDGNKVVEGHYRIFRQICRDPRDRGFFFIQRAIAAKLVGDIRQYSPRNLVAAPSLKAPMHGFLVRIALRQHVPLRAGVEYPQYSFENTSGRDRLASRTSIGHVLFRKMIPDALPLPVCQPNHPTFIADRLRLAILR